MWKQTESESVRSAPEKHITNFNIARPEVASTRPGGDENFPFSFLTGGSEMGDRIRAFDWSQTPIGSPEKWSSALKTMLQIMLANRFPHILWWGPEYVQFYNDAYQPIPGTKHPEKVLGQRACECWSEIWHVIGPLIDRPFRGGPATWDDDILLEINRHKFTEESHFTIAYSPVPDETVERGIGGVLATVHEITEKVVGERRVVALRDLGARLAGAKTPEEVCKLAAKVTETHNKDVPFALLYLVDKNGRKARLAGVAGLDSEQEFSLESVDLEETFKKRWPFVESIKTGEIQVIENLGDHFADIPKGPWSDPPNLAVVLTLPSSKPQEPAGFLVAGVSARLKLDQFYKDFFELVRTQIATAINNARAYEEERRRAEALAEIDRAKTAFFSNVSHEFRTPLTLLLGPAEDLLALKHGNLSPETADQVGVIHRNALRLQRLVNTLLDFSRIEAGRIRGRYVATDLAAFTGDLASVFRSAMEKAGLNFIVEVPPLPGLVFVDREMWEKIVFNLLSNAFKFTLKGEVRVSLITKDNSALLSVTDTGIGVPGEEMPNLFKRFHRVEGRGGRTHEGTGIGLALVQELVRLHGGNISVESTAGYGTAFRVQIPFGNEHLPAEQIDLSGNDEPTAPVGQAFMEEALTWLPENKQQDPGGISTGDQDSGRPHVLLVEDNADMRSYANRLLQPAYAVEAVANGALALEAARRNPPDLILSDVMMPEMNGFELISAVRADERLQGIPVILLSARAGEEARIEGASQLAEDYVVKPFSARELLARIDTQLRLKRVRSEAADAIRKERERLQFLTEAAQVGVWFCDLPFDELIWDQRVKEHFWLPPNARVTIDTFYERLHPDDRARARAAIAQAIDQKDRYVIDYRTVSTDGREKWIRAIGHPHYDKTGKPVRFDGITIDIGAEARNRFLIKLDDFLRPLSDPKEIVLTAARILGEQLAVDRCAYAEVENDGDTMNLAGNYLRRPEIKSIIGRLKFSDFGAEALRMMREGKPYVVEDIDTHQPPLTDLASYRKTQIQSVICVPLYKAGRFVAAMAVHMASPRRWTSDDVELVRAVAARCWESIERSRLERGLIESEERFRAFVTTSSDVMYRMSPDWGEMLHLEGKNFISDTESPERGWLNKYIQPEDQPTVMAAINEAIRTRSTFQLEHRVIRMDGTEGWTSSRAIPLLDAQGQITEWFGAAADVTERRRADIDKACLYEAAQREITQRKRVEEELRHAQQELSHHAEDLEKQVEARTASLREALAQLEEFSYSVSHDLRSPLRAISGYNRALREDYGASLPAPAQRYLEKIGRNSERMEHLVNDVLSFSRVARGEQQLHPIPLQRFIEEVREQHPSMQEPLSKMTIDAPHAVMADEAPLGQAISNLLTNAIKFVSSGEKPVVHVRSEQMAERVRLWVEDFGIGIAPQYRKQLFGMFQRLPAKEHYEGTGIGLAIVRKAVERMGGSVGMEDNEPKGSRFWIELKAAT
jgi:signal transduction histidine kinase/DNA-binding response OmpR family regulator